MMGGGPDPSAFVSSKMKTPAAAAREFLNIDTSSSVTMPCGPEAAPKEGKVKVPLEEELDNLIGKLWEKDNATIGGQGINPQAYALGCKAMYHFTANEHPAVIYWFKKFMTAAGAAGKIIIFLILLTLAGCKEDSPKLIQQNNLPPGHSLYYSRAKNGWLPVYHWPDVPDTAFLVYVPILKYVHLFGTKSYAVGYPTRDSAMKIINLHWEAMEKDRKSHGQ